MRTLGEISEAVRSNERPDYEELRYAVLAYQALTTFDSRALMRLSEAEREQKKPMLSNSAVFQYREHFTRFKLALAKSPQEWVGWNNDPANPEFQKHRAIGLKLLDRFTSNTGAKHD